MRKHVPLSDGNELRTRESWKERFAIHANLRPTENMGLQLETTNGYWVRKLCPNIFLINVKYFLIGDGPEISREKVWSIH